MKNLRSTKDILGSHANIFLCVCVKNYSIHRRPYSETFFFVTFHMSAFGTSPVRSHSKKKFLLRVTKDPHLTNIASNVRCMGLNQNLFRFLCVSARGVYGMIWFEKIVPFWRRSCEACLDECMKKGIRK